MSDDEWDLKTKKCFESWQKITPHFEYKLWNFKTLPKEVLEVTTVKNAIAQKKWAFVADYVRFWALYNYGGVYMDLDVEMFKPIDELLNTDLLLGLEKSWLGAHFIGATKNHPFIKNVMITVAEKKSFQPVPDVLTVVYNNFYNKDSIIPAVDEKIAIYPNEYFNPFLWDDKNNSGKLEHTKNTYVVHWYAGGWIPKWKKTKTYKFLSLVLNKTGVMAILRMLRGY